MAFACFNEGNEEMNHVTMSQSAVTIEGAAVDTSRASAAHAATTKPTAVQSRVEKAQAPNPWRHLKAAISAIDTCGDPADAEEVRILRKLELVQVAIDKGDLVMPLLRNGCMEQSIVLKRIGHAGVERTPAIVAALETMAHRHLLTSRTRHTPEAPIDLLLDAYEHVLTARGYGPPRNGTYPKEPSRAAVAREVPCRRRNIDAIAYRRIKLMMVGLAPGPIVSTRKPFKRAPNGALGPLLNDGLAELASALPEDPLYPGRPDLITIAEVAGISVSEIIEIEELRSKIQSATVGKTLVPHPVLAQRRYSWAELIEWGRGRCRDTIGAAEARKAVMALRTLVNFVAPGDAETDLVPLDFKSKARRGMLDRYREVDPGWRRWIALWIEWNGELRATKPLPANFGLKLRILLAESDTTLGGLEKELRGMKGSLDQWVDGRAHPSVASEPKLAAVAERLGVPLSTLKADMREEWRIRAFDLSSLGYRGSAGKRLPFDFEEEPDLDKRREKLERNAWRFDKQDTAYARRLPSLHRDEYRLDLADWPERLVKAWEANRPKSTKPKDGLRRIGDQTRLERDANGKLKQEPAQLRDSTVEMRRRVLDYVFGYMHRSRDAGESAAAVATDTSPTDYVPEGGLGIPIEHLSMALLALPDLVTAFTHFRARRSGSTGRAVTMALKAIANLLMPERGIVWRSPAMLADLEAFVEWWDANPMSSDEGEFVFDIQSFRDDWQDAVAHTYHLIRDDVEGIQSANDGGEMTPTRDGFKSVQVYVDHDRPMEHYMRSVRAMIASRPTNMIFRHVHTRDCVMALILVQTGLRTHNMLFTFDDGRGLPEKRTRARNGTVLQPTIRRVEEESRVRWMISIPSSEFKNFYSPYFKGKRPYEHELRDEDGLYAMLDRYVNKSRRYMLRGRRSDAFFVTDGGGNFTERYAGMNYRRLTGTYFIYNADLDIGGVVEAMPHGMHAVRNVIATHIVRVTGDLHLAAWAIQDQVRTVERHYARFIPKDKVKLADRVLAEARAAGRPE